MEVIKDVELHVGTPTMSINQMAEFVAASERGKRAIVRKQSILRHFELLGMQQRAHPLRTIARTILMKLSSFKDWRNFRTRRQYRNGRPAKRVVLSKRFEGLCKVTFRNDSVESNARFSRLVKSRLGSED